MTEEDLTKIEKLLLNIESLSDDDKKYLKEKLVSSGYIIDWLKGINVIYNKLSSNQLSLMIDILDVTNSLNDDFASIIEDKTKLPVIPYINRTFR